MERFREKRAALAFVLFGEGFWVSAMRAAITGVQALTRSKISLNIFSRVEEVAEWLPAQHEARTGVRLDSEALLEVLRGLAATL